MSKHTLARWEPFRWRAPIQRVDQTVDRQTQGCDLVFKGPLQTLLICRPKRLIRQGSDAQSCKRSGSSATSRIPHTHLVRLEPELITSVNCVHHDSYPTDASLPPCHCGKQLIYLQIKMQSGIFWQEQTLLGVLDRFLLLVRVFLATDTDQKGRVLTQTHQRSWQSLCLCVTVSVYACWCWVTDAAGVSVTLC